MNTIYIVVENGDPYSTAYKSYDSAAAAIKAKYGAMIEEELALEGSTCSEIDVPENKVTGKTYMYVEKGIHIYIYKMSIVE
jgi:hypothetical protein